MGRNFAFEVATLHPVSAKGIVTVTLFGHSAQANAAPTKRRVTVSAGTRILIRLADSIDSTKQKAGYRFTATINGTVYPLLTNTCEIKLKEKAGIPRRKSWTAPDWVH